MLDCTPGLATWLNETTQGVTRGLVTLTLRGGAVYRWARAKSAITFGGVTWQPHGQGGRPILSWQETPCAIGTGIESVNVLLECGDGNAMLGAKRMTLAAIQRDFEGATLKIERAYMDTAAGPVIGILPEFSGTVQSSPCTSTTVTLVVESDIAKLARPFPARLLTAECPNTLYDAACGASRSIAGPCDKTAATCQSKFDNLARFAGAPAVPTEE